jgi:hypothetical protein
VWLNKFYGAWIKSKNDTSVSDASESKIDSLKSKSETEKPFNDAPNDKKNERLQCLKNKPPIKKIISIQIQKDSSKILIREGNLYLKRLALN